MCSALRAPALVSSCWNFRAAVFSGSDGTGYGYCLASHDEDLRPLGKQMTAALSGKGGGKPDFQQGSVKAGKSEILAFFASVQ